MSNLTDTNKQEHQIHLPDADEKMETVESSTPHDKLEIVLKVKEEPADDANKSPENSQVEDRRQLPEEFILPDVSTEDSCKAVDVTSKTKQTKDPLKANVPPPPKAKYQCSVCKVEYTHKFHFKRHMNLKPCSGIPAPGHKCTICGKVYKRKDNLRVHFRSHTGEPPKYERKMNHTCDFCGKQYHHISALEIHVRKHTGEKPFPCDVCEKSFPSNGQLTLHLLKHTKEKPFACKECGARFGRRSSLKRHTRLRCNTPSSQHGGGTSPYTKELMQLGSLKGIKLSHNGERIFECKECGEELHGKKSLHSHVCSINFFRQTLKHTLNNILEVNSAERVDCDEKQAEENQGTSENVQNDDSCASANEHNESGGGSSCKKCRKFFSSIESLQKHVCAVVEPNSSLSDDIKLKPHQCTICFKRFALKHVLTMHVVTHTKEKPCSCDQCGRAFIRRDCLIRHMKRTRHKCEDILLD